MAGGFFDRKGWVQSRLGTDSFNLSMVEVVTPSRVIPAAPPGRAPVRWTGTGQRRASSGRRVECRHGAAWRGAASQWRDDCGEEAARHGWGSGGGGDGSEGCLRWDPLEIAQLACLLAINFLDRLVTNSSEIAHMFGSLLSYLS
jgi:hypothetical protein